MVLKFRGAIVASNPITVPYPESLRVEVTVDFRMPGESNVMLYLCVTDTPQVLGEGTCNAVITTVALVQRQGNIFEQGISHFKAGASVTTRYVYVGLAEGTFPTVFVSQRLPQVGEIARGSRVLATAQIPQSVTFQ